MNVHSKFTERGRLVVISVVKAYADQKVKLEFIKSEDSNINFFFCCRQIASYDTQLLVLGNNNIKIIFCVILINR